MTNPSNNAAPVSDQLLRRLAYLPGPYTDEAVEIIGWLARRELHRRNDAGPLTLPPPVSDSRDDELKRLRSSMAAGGYDMKKMSHPADTSGADFRPRLSNPNFDESQPESASNFRYLPPPSDKPFPPDPDAGYVRPHAEIHADLLKVNLENAELRRSMSETSNPGEPGIEKLLDGLRAINVGETTIAALVGYVEELRKERDKALAKAERTTRLWRDLRESHDDLKVNRDELRRINRKMADVHSETVEIHEAEIERLLAELSTLRELHLTPEEAWWLSGEMRYWNYIAVAKPELFAKLRLLSESEEKP